jgi:hypothetical protein
VWWSTTNGTGSDVMLFVSVAGLAPHLSRVTMSGHGISCLIIIAAPVTGTAKILYYPSEYNVLETAKILYYPSEYSVLETVTILYYPSEYNVLETAKILYYPSE